MSRPLVIIVAAAASLASLFAAGCSGRAGGQDLELVNNRLREQNLELRERVATLEQQLAELQIALQPTAEGESASPQLSAEQLANLPRVTTITLDRWSGIAREAAGRVLRVYVKPADGRGRFTQMTGDVTIKLISVPTTGDAVTAAEHTFGPAEVREAYRSSVMGTHYTFEVPIELPEGAADATWLLLVEYRDAVTGAALKAEKRIEPSM